MQLNHYNSPFSAQKFPIVLICENVTNAANVGSLFRTADAFGIEKLIFCGSNVPMGRKMLRSSRATEKYVAHEFQEDIVAVVDFYKQEGYCISAVEITSGSQSISETAFGKKGKYVFIVGDENFGVSEPVLAISDKVFHINMFGHNSSMNVVQAATIALYELTKQLNA